MPLTGDSEKVLFSNTNCGKVEIETTPALDFAGRDYDSIIGAGSRSRRSSWRAGRSSRRGNRLVVLALGGAGWLAGCGLAVVLA